MEYWGENFLKSSSMSWNGLIRFTCYFIVKIVSVSELFGLRPTSRNGLSSWTEVPLYIVCLYSNSSIIKTSEFIISWHFSQKTIENLIIDTITTINCWEAGWAGLGLVHDGLTIWWRVNDSSIKLLSVCHLGSWNIFVHCCVAVVK